MTTCKQKTKGTWRGTWLTFPSARQELNNEVINWLSGKIEQNQRQLTHNRELVRAARRVAHKRRENNRNAH